MKYIIFLCTSTVLLTSCKSSKKISNNYTYEIECMGADLDGSITLKTWGKGKDKEDALKHAKKEAINTVLFVGIRNGKPDCDTRPILNAPNIREIKADYFNGFFKDGGDYMKYATNKDESLGKNTREKGHDGDLMYGFIIRVLRSELKKQMITNGILNN